MSFFLITPFAATLLSTQSHEISPIKAVQVSQTDAFLLYAGDFIVAEDGIIFITDAKDGNIKCYDPEGKLLKVIGRRGPGPEEFGGPTFCDYQAPFLSVLDGPKFKVYIYERKGRADLIKVAVIPCMMCLSDVVLSGESIVVDTPAYNGERLFFLTQRDFQDKAAKYLLPSERRFGYDSEKSYKANYDDMAMLTSQRGFLSVSGNRAHFVLDARLKITGVNLDGSEIVTFGTPSANYREPRINQTIKNAFSRMESEPVKMERNKVSFITGILSDDCMVGVLFSNYDAPSESWRLYLQRYEAGKFVSEYFLRDVCNYDCLFNYYFQRESGVLYILAENYGNESTDDYRIFGYKLR